MVPFCGYLLYFLGFFGFFFSCSTMVKAVTLRVGEKKWKPTEFIQGDCLGVSGSVERLLRGGTSAWLWGVSAAVKQREAGMARTSRACRS